jgi:hypothetical protein
LFNHPRAATNPTAFRPATTIIAPPPPSATSNHRHNAVLRGIRTADVLADAARYVAIMLVLFLLLGQLAKVAL